MTKPPDIEIDPVLVEQLKDKLRAEMKKNLNISLEDLKKDLGFDDDEEEE